MIKLLADVGKNPLRYVEWVIAILIIVGGLYLFSPWVDMSMESTSTVAQALQTKASIYAFAVFYTFPGVAMAYGLVKNKPRVIEVALYFTYIVLLFSAILTLVVNGLFPPRWLTILTVGVIAAILWLREKYTRTWN